MNNKIRNIITKLNVARSNNCDAEKSREIKDIINELVPLAELEEELGIELLTLFKMLKNGFYIRTEAGIIFIKNEDEWEKLKSYNEFKSEYGKTWALTKEELL